MRIHFKNLGQANLCLKTCKRKLTDYLERSGEVRLPSQRVRNAFCQGFGYSSFDELTRVLSNTAREFKPLPSEEDFLGCFTKGFSLAFEVVADYEPARKLVYQYMAPVLAHEAVEELKREGSAEELFTQSPGERAGEHWRREIINAAWASVDNPPGGEISARRLAEAEEKFRQAITADPELADAYNGLAFVEFSRENYSAARRHAETALEKARRSLGTDEPAAFTWYDEIKTRPYMRARHNLGLSLMRLGDWKGAAREFKELLKRDPNDNQGVRYLIGSLYHSAGDLRHAIPAYRKSAGNDEYSGDPHNEFNYALALYETGKYVEAVLRFRYATFRNLHIPQVLLDLPIKRLGIWYGSNDTEPDYAIAYHEEYGHLWQGKTGALAFLRAVYFHPTVQGEVEEYIDLGRKLKGTHGHHQRFPIVEAMSRHKALWRLRENNKAVAAEVSAGREAASSATQH